MHLVEYEALEVVLCTHSLALYTCSRCLQSLAFTPVRCLHPLALYTCSLFTPARSLHLLAAPARSLHLFAVYTRSLLHLFSVYTRSLFTPVRCLHLLALYTCSLARALLAIILNLLIFYILHDISLCTYLATLLKSYLF